MFELATDFSKRTVYPEFLDIDPNWDYEESQKQATRYIKTLICRNIEIPNKEPIVFSYLYISIYTNSMSILCAVTNRFTKEEKSKYFYNIDEFINYYNNITKNKGDI